MKSEDNNVFLCVNDEMEIVRGQIKGYTRDKELQKMLF